MSTPAKELIAVAHVAFLNNEAALKQLVTIFNRIVLRRGKSTDYADYTDVTMRLCNLRNLRIDLTVTQRACLRFKFSVEPRKLALLEAESTLPGSIVAFVTQAKSMFSS